MTDDAGPTMAVIRTPNAKIPSAVDPETYASPKSMMRILSENRTINKNPGNTRAKIHFVTLEYVRLNSSIRFFAYNPTMTGPKICPIGLSTTPSNLDVGSAALYTPTSVDVQKYPSMNVSVQPVTMLNIPTKINGKEK